MVATHHRLALVSIMAIACAACAYAQADDERGTRFYVDAQATYDDNLFRLPSAPASLERSAFVGTSRQDSIGSGSIGMAGKWTAGLQTIDLDARADYNRFAHNSSLNNAGWDTKLQWDWRVSDRWSGKVGTSFNRALASFANNYFLGKDSLTNYGYSGELDWQLGARWFASASASRIQTSHSAVVREIDNYNSYSGTFAVTYTDSLGDVFAWEYGYATGRFPHAVEVNDLPFDRSYHDNSSGFRTTYLLTGKITLRASAGYLRRSYPNAGIGNFSGSIWRAALEWRPGAKSQITLSSWRGLTAYVDSQSDYFVSNGVSITPTWMPTDKLQFSVLASRERESFIGSNPGFVSTNGRRDKNMSAQLAGTWTPRQSVTMTLSYQLSRRDSSVEQFAYGDSLVSLRLRLIL